MIGKCVAMEHVGVAVNAVAAHRGSPATRGEDGKLPLRVMAIKTATQLKALTVGQLCEEADVVLCSYRLLGPPSL